MPLSRSSVAPLKRLDASLVEEVIRYNIIILNRSTMSDQTSIVLAKSTHRDLRQKKPDGMTWEYWIQTMAEEWEARTDD